MSETSSEEIVLNLSLEDMRKLVQNYAKELRKTEKNLNEVVLELENQRVTNQMLINRMQKYNQIIANLKVQNDVSRVKNMVNELKSNVSNVVRINLAIILIVGVYYKDWIYELCCQKVRSNFS